MSLTAAQLPAYKAAILAETDPVVVQALADGANNVITDFYNQLTAPAYWIQRQEVPVAEIKNAIVMKNVVDITTADAERVGLMLDIRGAADGLGFFSGEDIPDAANSDRAAWDDVFSAATGDESQQAIAALWDRIATNIEKVFALSTGSGADAANADSTSFQGPISLQDTRDALALP